MSAEILCGNFFAHTFTPFHNIRARKQTSPNIIRLVRFFDGKRFSLRCLCFEYQIVQLVCINSIRLSEYIYFGFEGLNAFFL